MRKDITPIQTALGNKGYDVGIVDGLATEKTYNAVLKYQTDNGLTADGMVGPATKVMLLGGTSGEGTVSSTLKLGSNGSLTLYLQRLLKELNYQVELNGIFDTQTREAAIAFQTANLLEADGIVGGGTWKKLFELYHVDVEGSDVEKLIAVAQHELEWEFKEDNANNITPYGQWYNMNGSAWCAMFVSYCAYQAGVLNDLVPKYAWCQSGMTWYKDRKRYFKRNSGYVPKRGDIIFFFNDELGRVAHTGIVIDGDEKYVTTIEGNTSLDRVQKCTYTRTHSKIDGYGDNGGRPISIPPKPTEEEYLAKVYELIKEVVYSIGFSIDPPFIASLENDIPVFESDLVRVTFKCSRGSSWYTSIDSPFSVDFEFGKPTLGIDLTPNINIALAGVLNKDEISLTVSNLAMNAGSVPVKFEYSIEGEWHKITYVVECAVYEGAHHEDTISYGFTVWIKNVPENNLAPELAKVEEYSYSPAPDISKAAVSVAVIALLLVGTVAIVSTAGTAGPVIAGMAVTCSLVMKNTQNLPGGDGPIA